MKKLKKGREEVIILPPAGENERKNYEIVHGLPVNGGDRQKLLNKNKKKGFGSRRT